MDSLPTSQQFTPSKTPVVPSVQKSSSFDFKYLFSLIILLVILGLVSYSVIIKPIQDSHDPSRNLRLQLNQDLNDPAMTNLFITYFLEGKIIKVRSGPLKDEIIWTIQPLQDNAKPRDIKIGIHQPLLVQNGDQASPSAVPNLDLSTIPTGSTIFMNVTISPNTNDLPIANNIRWNR